MTYKSAFFRYISCSDSSFYIPHESMFQYLQINVDQVKKLSQFLLCSLKIFNTSVLDHVTAFMNQTFVVKGGSTENEI